MKDNREEIRPYVADMAAVERHILEALERQHKDDTFKDYPQALGLIDRLAGLLKTHVENLETHLDSLPGGGVAAAVKETVTGVLGGLAGVYDKVRKDKVSRALRDDYTALSLAVISYTMLHSTALGLRQGTTAEIALRNLKELTPILIELSQIIPAVVLKELSFEGYDIDFSLSPQAVRDTQEAWSRESTTANAPVGAGGYGGVTR
jgi:ferritin-like metal-binding protein YciE